MSDAKKCDRCGAFYTDITTGLSKCRDDEFTFTHIKLIYSTIRSKPIDLCQRCIDELSKWLNNEENNKEDGRLTCFELLAKDHPKLINSHRMGGCEGCPHQYHYIYSDKILCREISPSKELCTKCWNQVADRFYDERRRY